jgi:hypothetical protein
MLLLKRICCVLTCTPCVARALCVLRTHAVLYACATRARFDTCMCYVSVTHYVHRAHHAHRVRRVHCVHRAHHAHRAHRVRSGHRAHCVHRAHRVHCVSP